MESYATNLLVICGHISFGMDFFTIFLAVCHCRGHDFLDIACRGCRFVIAKSQAKYAPLARP